MGRTPLHLTAFIEPTVPGARASLESHAGALDEVAVVGLVLGEGGSVIDRIDQSIVDLARLRGLPVLAVLQNIDEAGEGWRPERVAALARDRRASDRVAAQLVAIAARRGLSGVHLDLEELDDLPPALLEAIVGAAAKALRAQHLWLAVDVAADLPRTQLARLAELADEVVVMAYDEHDEDGAPGPIASEPFVARVVAAAGPVPITLALGIYGYDWIEDQPGDPVSFVDAHAAAREARVLPGFDEASGNTHLQFSDDEGVHDLWLLDAASLWNQLGQRGPVKRLALWRLGGEDPGIWDAIEAHRRPELAQAAAQRLAEVPPDPRIDNLGDGPFLSLSLAREAGVRAVEVRAAAAGPGQVASVRWERSPAPWVVRRAGIERGRVAITFDDGPDPRATPAILDVLRDRGAPAAFFVVGLQAERFPDLVARAFREGHTLGNHTFTHPDVDRVPEIRLQLELEATTRLVEALVGRRPLLYRPPSLVDIEPRTEAGVTAFARAGALGYLVVDADVDPRDWDTGDEEAIARRTLAGVGEGGVVLLHDGGGDRSATARALPQILDGLASRGLTVVPLEQLVGKRRDEVLPPARARPMAETAADRAVFSATPLLLRCGSVALAAALLLAALRAVLLLLAAVASARRRQRRPWPQRPLPSASVVIPAYNEAAGIVRTVSSVLASDLPLQIIVVDDGSTDGTAGKVLDAFGEHRRVSLIARKNGGKAEALRQGFALARTEVVVALDGDTLFAADTVRRLLEPMVDPRVGAVAGSAEVGNRGGALAACQEVEYLVQQEVERRAFDLVGALPVVPGAVGAWRRKAVAAVGGFSPETLAEDADLAMALCRGGWLVVHAPAARAWTEVPDTAAGLVKQRVRWNFGTLQAMWKHRRAIVEPAAGWFGRLVLPLLVVSQLVVPLLSPLAVLGALAAAVAGNLAPALAASSVLVGLEVAQLLVARGLDERGGARWPRRALASQLATQLTCQLWYRPLLLAVLLRSLARTLDGIPLGWNKLARRGSVEPPAQVAA